MDLRSIYKSQRHFKNIPSADQVKRISELFLSYKSDPQREISPRRDAKDLALCLRTPKPIKSLYFSLVKS